MNSINLEHVKAGYQHIEGVVLTQVKPLNQAVEIYTEKYTSGIWIGIGKAIMYEAVGKLLAERDIIAKYVAYTMALLRRGQNDDTKTALSIMSAFADMQELDHIERNNLL